MHLVLYFWELERPICSKFLCLNFQIMEEERRIEISKRAKGKGKLRMTWEEIAINAAVTDEKVIKDVQG